MLRFQRLRLRSPSWANLLICFVFLAIRISAVHAHQHILVPHANAEIVGAETLATDLHHIEVGLFHLDHSDLPDQHDQSEPSLANLAHQDVKTDGLLDGFGKNSKLSQQQLSFVATVLLWHLIPEPASVIPRYRAPTGGPQRPRLRPPSCGPPELFIA